LDLEEREGFPKASEVLCSSFFVDDFEDRCATPEEIIKQREQVCIIVQWWIPLTYMVLQHQLSSIVYSPGREKMFCPALLLMNVLSRF
jgi:hypothetical protein